MKHLFIVLAIVAFAMSCTGPEGPTGPAGKQGEPGPGSRIVYQSTEPIPTNYDFTVYVPEIKLNDMPVVSVYIRIGTSSEWVELPFYFEGFPDWGLACFLQEGAVVFNNCKSSHYKIVVIT